jgi:hypothetical protein
VRTAAVAALGAGWPLRGWSRGDLLALAGVLVAIVIAIVPPVRRAVAGGWRSAMLQAGLPRRRYLRWFAGAWGVYENPYLDDKENLDLSNTYVPLSFHAGPADHEQLSLAIDVLANGSAGNLVIEGAPGCGKSTLLKAFGVGVAQGGPFVARRSRPVPFLIQLRKLARYGGDQISIADYLVSEILVSGAGMEAGPARQFLGHALGRDQVLVMLDGLDEVTAERYPAVLEAVYRFKNDRRPDCPSSRARLIVTCRGQNFLPLRKEWVPAIAGTVCSLAPLRDSEIFSYLDKLRPKFRTAGGPESFLQAVRASGTLDLHRVPLVLAMSVGLYARKDYFEIPSSIARLYQQMIEEMLDRHRFKGDPGGAAVAFQLGDKYRFLREFALHAARGRWGFDEFAKSDLIACARTLAPDLDAVADPVAFTEEIVQRSGLLTDVGESGRYIFAHRSIQEFLAAEELRRTGGGGEFLLERAGAQQWRQVIQFYAASLEQHQANAFLPDLARRNQELAGRCLAAAKPSDDEAAVVLDALLPVDAARLTALAAATMSPRVPVQQMAISRLAEALARPDSPLSALSGEVSAMLPILGSLAGTNAAQIAALVPQIIEHVPDDPRLVDPLWRCLAAPGIEGLPACRAIVARLLGLAADPDGFAELARQDPYTRSFLTTDLREQAYPFTGGLELEHNLVTLLAWADYLDVTPAEPNRYFEAKRACRLGRVETDRRRAIIFSPYLPALAFSTALSMAAVTAAVIIAVAHPGWLLRPLSWWTPAVIAGAALVVFAILFIHVGFVADLAPKDSRLRYYIGVDEGGSFNSHAMDLLPRKAPVWVFDATVFVLMPVTIAVDLSPVMARSVVLYFAVTFLAGLLYWAPVCDFFGRRRRYYVYKPSPYIDLYDDPRCGHWVSGSARAPQVPDEAGTGEQPSPPLPQPAP